MGFYKSGEAFEKGMRGIVQERIEHGFEWQHVHAMAFQRGEHNGGVGGAAGANGVAQHGDRHVSPERVEGGLIHTDRRFNSTENEVFDAQFFAMRLDGGIDEGGKGGLGKHRCGGVGNFSHRRDSGPKFLRHLFRERRRQTETAGGGEGKGAAADDGGAVGDGIQKRSLQVEAQQQGAGNGRSGFGRCVRHGMERNGWRRAAQP